MGSYLLYAYEYLRVFRKDSPDVAKWAKMIDTEIKQPSVGMHSCVNFRSC